MDKPILFYSELCPDTKPFVAELERLGIAYETVNIFDSMPNFKRFLQIRDNNHHFDDVKKLGNAGVPALFVNDECVILALEQLASLQ